MARKIRSMAPTRAPIRAFCNPHSAPGSIFNYINVQQAKNAYAQETHTFSANTINIARFGYNDSDIYYSTTGTWINEFRHRVRHTQSESSAEPNMRRRPLR